MISVALSLGSNLGDRRLHLRRCIVELGAVLDLVRISSLFETEPLGATEGSGPYLNLVALVTTSLAPVPLHERLGDLELRLGRRRNVRNAPRSIDIDIIFYGATVMRSAQLELTHPRFREREFVLAPLRELEIDWIDPRSLQRVSQMSGEGEVRRIGSLWSEFS